ncbi:MAG: hypothetical protein D6766_12710 [Verrucomicrobia bacterium]|nr:MAG: hypothetical protein D6766_12710 [Verrucomicrobiota bacterium]
MNEGWRVRRGAALATVFVLSWLPVLHAGTLAVHPDNPLWFTDGSGRAICLAGHQSFVDLQDNSFNKAFIRGHVRTLDWDEYVRFLKAHRFNYLRNWVIWSTGSGSMAPINRAIATPMPYERVPGHGKARDGGDKFDLTRFNEAFFQRLRRRCRDLQENGIHVSIMLFEVYGFLRGEEVGTPPQALWDGNVFNGANNINGIDVDEDGNGNGMEFFFTDDPRIRELQRAYARKVLDTLNDLDNVFYEIANELEAPQWQHEMIRFIRRYEKSKPKQHLVLMSAGGRTRSGRWRQMGPAPLIQGPADCFAVAGSWNGGRFRRKDPPENRAGKPGIVDMDHVSPGSTDVGYVWSAFTRGYHFNLYDRPFEQPDAEGPEWERIRRSVGRAASYARRLDLVRARPRSAMSSTHFCLGDPNDALVVYQPRAGDVRVTGLQAGRYGCEVFDARAGEVVRREHADVRSGVLSISGLRPDSVVYIEREKEGGHEKRGLDDD